MGSTQKDRDRGGGKRGSEIKNERGRTDRQNWAENRAGHRERGGGGEGRWRWRTRYRERRGGWGGGRGTDSFPFRNLSSQSLILKQFLCCKSHSLRWTGPRLTCNTISVFACTVMLKVWTVSFVNGICRQARVKHDTCRGQVLSNALHDRFPFLFFSGGEGERSSFAIRFLYIFYFIFKLCKFSFV